MAEDRLETDDDLRARLLEKIKVHPQLVQWALDGNRDICVAFVLVSDSFEETPSGRVFEDRFVGSVVCPASWTQKPGEYLTGIRKIYVQEIAYKYPTDYKIVRLQFEAPLEVWENWKLGRLMEIARSLDKFWELQKSGRIE